MNRGVRSQSHEYAELSSLNYVGTVRNNVLTWKESKLRSFERDCRASRWAPCPSTLNSNSHTHSHRAMGGTGTPVQLIKEKKTLA